MAPTCRLVVSRMAVLVLVALALLATPAVSGRASAGGVVQAILYAAPGGSGDACAEAFPCSLTGARDKVRTLDRAMTGHLVVRLLDGTYELPSPFELRPQDSGSNGFKVIYEAAPGAHPRLSAGRRITGWQQGGGGLWTAQVGDLRTRQLYVDGTRATRARGPVQTAAWSKTASGFVAPDDSMAGWSAYQDITDTELVGNSQWRQFRCPVASISGRAVTVQNPCWQNSQLREGDTSPTFDTVTWVESSPFLLDEPGEWFLDRRTGVLSYLPRPGEDLARAEVVAAVGEAVVDAAGDPGDPLHDVELRGLTFADTTWLGPGAPEGYVSKQAGWHRTGSGHGALAEVPAGVRLRMARSVMITGNTFTSMGGTALTLGAGVQDTVVDHNGVVDVSGAGVQIGQVNEPSPAPSDEVRNVHVLDNTIVQVAREYQDTVGIFAGYTADTDISYNEVEDLPYTGISVGWGWGEANSSRNAFIAGNDVHDVMQALVDGGAIYVVGVTAADPASTIHSNYLHNVKHPYGALYLDGASNGWHVFGNVVAGISTNWLFLQPEPPKAVGNLVNANWSDTHQMSAFDPSNDVSGNDTGLSGFPAEATAIIDAAGPRPAAPAPTWETTSTSVAPTTTLAGDTPTTTTLAGVGTTTTTVAAAAPATTAGGAPSTVLAATPATARLEPRPPLAIPGTGAPGRQPAARASGPHATYPAVTAARLAKEQATSRGRISGAATTAALAGVLVLVAVILLWPRRHERANRHRH